MFLKCNQNYKLDQVRTLFGFPITYEEMYQLCTVVSGILHILTPVHSPASSASPFFLSTQSSHPTSISIQAQQYSSTLSFRTKDQEVLY